MSGILVVGASGFVGSHLVPVLAQTSDVFALARNINGICDLSSVRWIEAELPDADYEDRLPDKIDTVIYLAQSRRFREFPDGVRDMLEVNVKGVAAAAEVAARKSASRFILLSTGGVYGDGNGPFHEDEPLVLDRPLGAYAASKLSAELVLANFRDYFDPVILRPFFIYGPGQSPDMLLPRLAGNITKGETITLSAPDGLRINPIFVDDVVDVVSRALNLNAPAVINLAGPEIQSLGEIVALMGRLLGVDPVTKLVEGGSRENMVGDIKKFSSLLAGPTCSLELGLRRMIDAQ